MINTLDILYAIRDKILEAKKAEGLLRELAQIHIDLLPTKFKRPSVLIEYITSTEKAGGHHYINPTVFFTITVFSKKDTYYNNLTSDLLTLQDEIIKLFRDGYIAIKGTAVRVNATSGGREWNEAYIDLQLEYFDCRNENSDTEGPIENIHTRVINETDKKIN